MVVKQYDLFGDEINVQAKRTKAQIFEDYDAFVAKFNADRPKTTDECYTPQPVYQAVLEWLRGRANIEGRPIVRPFFPGGDYKNHEYPENCVVVAQKRPVVAKTRKYSDNVITSALLHKKTKGLDVLIYDNEVSIAKALDCGVDLFGGGYLISDAAAARIQDIQDIQDIPLSPREKKIIERLNAKGNKNDNSAEVR